MKEVQLQFIEPTVELPDEMTPILFVIENGRVVYGAFAGGVFYPTPNGGVVGMYRPENVLFWCDLPKYYQKS